MLALCECQFSSPCASTKLIEREVGRNPENPGGGMLSAPECRPSHERSGQGLGGHVLRHCFDTRQAPGQSSCRSVQVREDLVKVRIFHHHPFNDRHSHSRYTTRDHFSTVAESRRSRCEARIHADSTTSHRRLLRVLGSVPSGIEQTTSPTAGPGCPSGRDRFGAPPFGVDDHIRRSPAARHGTARLPRLTRRRCLRGQSRTSRWPQGCRSAAGASRQNTFTASVDGGGGGLCTRRPVAHPKARILRTNSDGPGV